MKLNSPLFVAILLGLAVPLQGCMTAIAALAGADEDTIAAAMQADALMVGATAAAVVENRRSKREAEAAARAHQAAIVFGQRFNEALFICTWADTNERYFFFALSDLEAEGMCAREFATTDFVPRCACVLD